MLTNLRASAAANAPSSVVRLDWARLALTTFCEVCEYRGKCEAVLEGGFDLVPNAGTTYDAKHAPWMRADAERVSVRPPARLPSTPHIVAPCSTHGN